MPTGSGAVLVDTNVLVYAYDVTDKIKQERATEVLARLAAEGVGVLSTQILGEFFVNATRKLSPALTLAEAQRSVNSYIRSWSIVVQTSATVDEAMRGVRRHQFSYWDGLIWATARLSGITVVLSEDFSDGSRVEGVRFVNPFTVAFDLNAVMTRA
jgi:predicted nucleic acid-binding protein